MKLDTIFKCSRPVLFENNDEVYTYSIGGTCFIAKFKQKHYVITAKHILRNFAQVQFRVQYHPASGDFIPLKKCFTLKQTDSDEIDCFDLAVFTVDESELSYGLFIDQLPYNLLESDKWTIYSQKSKYVYRGFPIETRSLDWIEKSIRQTAILGQGEYGGRASFDCCHVINLLNLKPLASLDGLSGSPLFQINHENEKFSREAFAGMIVRGTKESGKAYFIEHSIVLDAMRDIENGWHLQMEETVV